MYLSNHLTHAAIALYFLGDTRKHFDKYLTSYIEKKLEAANGPTRLQQDDTAVTDLDELLGKRKNYYQLLSHYRHLFEDKHKSSLERFIAEEFPKLSAGLVGSLFHALIQERNA